MQLKAALIGYSVAAVSYAATPCAQVSSSAAAVLQANPSATPIVDAQVAIDCLKSVPLGQTQALDLLDSIFPYVEWQTDVSYLKNPPPPPAYLEPAVDIWAALYQVYDKVQSSSYAGEYDFQADLFRTFNLAHDGHFRFFPDLLTEALSFSRNVSLVSVSIDGQQLPQIYVHDDIDKMVTTGFRPSPVSTINGEDAVTFLENWSQLGALNDPDALYNSLFYSKPFAAELPAWQGYFDGSARFGYIFPGLTTTLGFKNGTSSVYNTVANVIGNFTGVTDGQTMYEVFCTPSAPVPATAPIPPTPSPGQPAPGYPEPVVISSDFVVSGYYLNSTSNQDVAVLSMLTFEPEVPAEFQSVVQTFLADAKAAGKKKLVIDLSANGGGYILQGYDTFRQLFPQIEQDGFTRYRYTEALLQIAEQYARVIPEDFNPETASSDIIDMYESTPNYRYDYDLNDQPFRSIPQKFGPHEYNGDKFTSIIRWNLNDPLTTINSTYGMGMEITGYGSRRNFTQPFPAEDIILLYDGYCASTCTLFSEFMRTQAGVKSIAIGGRPSRGPMQGIGGVKGANNDGFDYIQYLADLALNSRTPQQISSENWTALTDLTLLAFERSSDTSINVRDNILPTNLVDGLPAQFVYEPADCRLFYEPEMIHDVTAMWEAAADAAWGRKQCVNGHLNLHKREISAREADELVRRVATNGRAVGVDRAAFEIPEKTMTWVNRQGRKVPF